MPEQNTCPDRRKLGGHYEGMAVEYLLGQGLSRIEANYSCPMGEIDLIMNDKDYLVFVEVRYRNSRSYAKAIETVTPAKQRKLIRTAQSYLARNPRLRLKPCRFDVIGIDKTDDGSLQLNWIKNAFPE